MQRDPIEESALIKALEAIKLGVNRRIAEKGNGAYAGKHEAYGIIAEEVNKELLDAVHADDVEGCCREMIDIAVACVVGIASLRKKEDWR